MFENNISSQVFQATWIRCSRQRSVTPFLGCLWIWLRSGIVPPNCRRQGCSALFVCSWQISRYSPEGSVHTTSWVNSCCGRCEVELPDSERIRVSHTRRNLLDGFYHSLAVDSQRVKKIPHANRVAMIHDESTRRQWRHVDTCVNPAYIASRGAKGSELHNLELWLHSLKFLRKEEKHWPEEPSQLPELSQDDSEYRKCPGRANVIIRSKVLEPLLWRYSLWDSLRKAIAWLIRFKEARKGF